MAGEQQHLVALRGDMPSGMGIHKLVNANELVALAILALSLSVYLTT